METLAPTSDFFLELPPELWLHVFRFIPRLGPLGLVSRWWHALVWRRRRALNIDTTLVSIPHALAHLQRFDFLTDVRHVKCERLAHQAEGAQGESPLVLLTVLSSLRSLSLKHCLFK